MAENMCTVTKKAPIGVLEIGSPELVPKNIPLVHGAVGWIHVFDGIPGRRRMSLLWMIPFALVWEHTCPLHCPRLDFSVDMMKIHSENQFRFHQPCSIQSWSPESLSHTFIWFYLKNLVLAIFSHDFPSGASRYAENSWDPSTDLHEKVFSHANFAFRLIGQRGSDSWHTEHRRLFPCEHPRREAKVRWWPLGIADHLHHHHQANPNIFLRLSRNGIRSQYLLQLHTHPHLRTRKKQQRIKVKRALLAPHIPRPCWSFMAHARDPLCKFYIALNDNFTRIGKNLEILLNEKVSRVRTHSL